MKSILEKATECFNNQDLEGIQQYWHEDIRLVELATGKVFVQGKQNIYDMDKPFILDPERKIILNNVVSIGNVDIGYKTFEHKEGTNIVICEIENGQIKTVYFVLF